MRQLTRTRLVAVVALLLLVACGEDKQPPAAIDATASVLTAVPTWTPRPTATAMSIAATGPSDPTITCRLDAEQLEISCKAHGYQESSQLKWTSTASWAYGGGAQWRFPIAEDLIVPATQVFLEECQASSCRTIELSIDTSALVPSSTPVPQPIFKLPFTTDDEPQLILPMGETILHDPPWGHPGIDFMWDHKPAPLIAAAAGEVGSITVNNVYGGFDIAVFTGEFVVTYHVFELYGLNPNIDVGSQVTASQAIGYPLDVSDEDDFHSTHWAFGTWEKLSEPITTPEGDVRDFITDYLCPIPFFTDSERARLSRIWEEAKYPGGGNEKQQFPDLCNGPYKNY